MRLFVPCCAQAMGIRRYVFMSIFNCNKHPEVPLMNIKAATEEFLASSKLPHTVLRLCGFHQVRLRQLQRCHRWAMALALSWLLLHCYSGCVVQMGCLVVGGGCSTASCPVVLRMRCACVRCPCRCLQHLCPVVDALPASCTLYSNSST
jgi:hypothetical protein